MNKAEVQRLYKAHVLPESKDPFHFESPITPGQEVLANNPFCGDKYHLQLEVEGDRIKEVSFRGFGCALSKASTSLLMKGIRGKSRMEAETYCDRFLAAINSTNDLPDLGEAGITTLIRLKDFEGRIDCIRLSWQALKDHLSNG